MEDIEGVRVYMDDVVIWGKDVIEHDNRLKEVMLKIKKVWAAYELGKVQNQARGDYICG